MVLLGTGIGVGTSLLVSGRSTSAASGYTIQRPGKAIGANDSARASNVSLSAPAGYTTQQMIFDDQFSGTTLDATKWSAFLGAQGNAWNNHGNLPAPYSGPNTPITENEAMFGPSQVSVDNGLTLTATRNTNQYAGTYPWISGVVTTEGKFSLPMGGWYVQVKAKMPDQTQGMWPAIWFLPGVPGTAANEFDGYEGGFVGADPNQIMHSTYFADQGQEQKNYSVKSDVTAGYHIYGFRFIPGHSITAYFDGRQVWQVRRVERHRHHPGTIRDHPRTSSGWAGCNVVAQRNDGCYALGEHGHRRGACVFRLVARLSSALTEGGPCPADLDRGPLGRPRGQQAVLRRDPMVFEHPSSLRTRRVACGASSRPVTAMTTPSLAPPGNSV